MRYVKSTRNRTTNHLSDNAFGKWCKVFITTFAAYIGTKHSPWELKDKESLNAMQDCWDHIYQSTTATKHRISGIHDVIFVLVGILALVKYRLIVSPPCLEVNTKLLSCVVEM
jgi:hypothetical protein